jgi:trehalose-6-phosphate synthase
LYRRADALLVNPLRDGLNLTAKEFVACQAEDPGVLLLSSGAGAWHELGPYALPANPQEVHKTVNSINEAMTMSHFERKARNQLLKMRVDANSLRTWWRCVTLASQPGVPAMVKQRAILGYASSAG